LQQKERVKGEITSSKGKKVLQAARGKKQEARRRRCSIFGSRAFYQAWRRAKKKTASF
jgi:hypothetical protein